MLRMPMSMCVGRVAVGDVRLAARQYPCGRKVYTYGIGYRPDQNAEAHIGLVYAFPGGRDFYSNISYLQLFAR